MSFWSAPLFVQAASLTSTAVTPSNTFVDATGVSYTLDFTTATTPSSIQRIDVKFSTASGGSTVPSGMDASAATLTSVSGITSTGWTIDTSGWSNGIIAITRSSAAVAASATAVTVVFAGITNSTHNACQGGYSLQDTCWAHITTYSSQDNSVSIDSADVSYTLQEDPFFTCEVQGVSSGTTTNGITSTVTTTPTGIPFGTLQAGGVSYATQKLIIKTNAPNGYVLYASLATRIQGDVSLGQIYPFGATNATWTTPQPWTTPTGTVANNNAGWFGANTTDTRVTGWSGNTSGEFGPLDTTRREVAVSTTPARTGDTVYVTYAFGVSALQNSDSYTGKVLYQVVPSF